MNTHWDTVWSSRLHRALSLFFSPGRGLCGLQCSILWQFHFKFHFSRSGVRIPVKAICLWCDSSDNSYQSIDKVLKKIFSIDWPLQKVKRRKKSEKIALTGIRTLDLETWNLKWNWNCHRTLWRKTGKAPYDCLLLDTVFQWVFIRQLAFSASRESWPKVYALQGDLLCGFFWPHFGLNLARILIWNRQKRRKASSQSATKVVQVVAIRSEV